MLLMIAGCLTAANATVVEQQVTLSITSDLLSGATIDGTTITMENGGGVLITDATLAAAGYTFQTKDISAFSYTKGDANVHTTFSYNDIQIADIWSSTSYTLTMPADQIFIKGAAATSATLGDDGFSVTLTTSIDDGSSTATETAYTPGEVASALDTTFPVTVGQGTLVLGGDGTYSPSYDVSAYDEIRIVISAVDGSADGTGGAAPRIFFMGDGAVVTYYPHLATESNPDYSSAASSYTAGTYVYKISNSTNTSFVGIKTPWSGNSITIESVTFVKIDNGESSNLVFNNISFDPSAPTTASVTLNNTGGGDYNGAVGVNVYTLNNGGSGATLSTFAYTSAKITASGEQTYDITLGDLTADQLYQLSAFYISDSREATEIGSATKVGSFTMNNAEGYATLMNPFAYTMPEGIEGTAVSAVTNDATSEGEGTLTLDWAYQAGDVVPSGTPLIVKTAADTEGTVYYYAESTGSGTAPETNLLYGSNWGADYGTGSGHPTDGKYYILSYNASGEDLGFYLYTEDGSHAVVGAHRACLFVANESASAKGYRLISNGEATAVESVEAAETAENAAVYNMQGMRVSNTDAKGIYIINGKKYVK